MENLKNIARKIIEGEYGYAGVRTLESDESYKVGDIARESYEWDLENDCSTYYTTGLTAGGTCATAFDVDTFYYEGETDEEMIDEMVKKMQDAIESNSGYPGNKVIVAGHSADTDYGYGDDDEVRIEDAKVVGVL